MIDLKNAEPSPRICEEGCLRWYEGNTANIEMLIDLYRICEETATEIPIMLTPTDKVRVCFKNKYLQTIYEFEFTNVKNNTIEICINKEISKKFKKGNYTYCVDIETIADDEEVTTVANDNRVVVE